MAEVRDCVQCGTAFTPRREHARFCTANCRMAWNRKHGGVAAAPVAAIDWSVIAMTEAADRFAWATEWDLAHAAAAASETVWWITLVDATLVRYQPLEYENALTCLGPERRRKTEETLTGLRYVRNRLGSSVDPATLIRPFHRSADGDSGTGEAATAWTWNTLPEPDLANLPESSRDWEMSRYRAYQARIAGRDVARVFAGCAGFLGKAAATVYAEDPLPAAQDAAR